MNFLNQLKSMTRIVTDTGDFKQIKQFTPVDATTNPSLIYKAAQEQSYRSLFEEALAWALKKSNDKRQQASIAT